VSGRVVGVELLFKGTDTCRGGKYKAEQMGLHRAKVREYEETEEQDEGCGLVFGKVPH